MKKENCILLLILILIYGCGTGFSPADKPSETDIIFSFDVPSTPSQPAIPELQAEITVDGEHLTTIPIDPENSPVRVSINNITAGNHTFTITYFTTTEQGRIDIASGETTAEISTEKESNIKFERIDRSKFDDDHDGFTNLAEIRLGRDPLDENDRPLSPLPLSGERYVLLDTIEGELYEGEIETTGGRYIIEDML